MVVAYWTIASLTFALILAAFLKDSTAVKRNLNAWLFVLVSSLLWPITLPFIISSKLRRDKLQASAKSSFSSKLNAAPATDS